MTPLEFINEFGVEEIARRAQPEGTTVVADLLTATVNGSDRSAWTAEEQANADQALLSIERALVGADALVRSTVNIPTEVVETVAQGWIGKLARYALYDDARPPHVMQDKNEFEQWRERQAQTGVTAVWLERV